MRKLAILFGGALLVTACANNPRPIAAVDLTNPLMAPGYLAAAASSDQFEIQSGRNAHPVAQSPSVHSFASMLEADHAQSTQMLMAAAQSAGITPPSVVLLPQHQAMHDQLRAAGSGPPFDMAFKQIQIQAHQEALALHQNYAANGDVPALRATAAQIVPVIQRHLTMAQSMQVAVAPPPPAPMAPQPVPDSGERG